MRTALLLLLLTLPLAAAEPLAIQDNSFLIEEAYNQEHGVVQHIFTFLRDRHGSYESTFTQEWPAGGLRHQLSFTLPTERRHVGDLMLNYRYQLVGDGTARLAVSPRASLIVPRQHGRRYGYDVNLPVSVAVSDRFVTHWNAGATKAPDEPLLETAGVSAIYAALPKVHLMLETRWVHDRESVLTIAPGVRWAHDFRSGLQIVPGIAAPIGSDHSRALFLYVSFEHPFRRQTR